MAAPAPNTNRRAEVEFAPNVPVTVALKFAQPKIVSGMNGERFMFSTTDNRVMFLDPEVAGKISDLGVNVREPFTITKQWDGHRDSPVAWLVARPLGEQTNGTFVAPALPPQAAAAAPSSGAAGVTPKPPASAASASPLVEAVNTYVDAFAACLEHALTKHSGRVKPDEVKSIFLTVAINRSQSRVA